MFAFSTQTFIQRRASLIEHMNAQGGGVAIVSTAPEAVRNRDTHYPYRFDSYFYYLTGFKEPEAVLVLVAGEQPRSILFCRPKDLTREIWDGYRMGPEAAPTALGVDEAFPIEALESALPDLIANQPALYASLGQRAGFDALVLGRLQQLREQSRAGRMPPPVIHDVFLLLDSMRLIKDDAELACMREAAKISAQAHVLAMQRTQPGMAEYQVQALIEQHFRQSGAEACAYPSIVAGGAHACVLHYVQNEQTLQAGDLLLIDAGCELAGYASDITRTFPVNGRFSPAQKAVYEIVLAAQTAAIAALKPGVSLDAYHQAAVEVLAQGMLDLGLLQGTLADALEQKTYQQFYMHRTGHWLGLDVHDVGSTKTAQNEWISLAPGMVLTVEPGCYIRPAEGVPEAFWNIGIRIEDSVVITENGVENLTQAVPKSIADIEALCAEA